MVAVSDGCSCGLRGQDQLEYLLLFMLDVSSTTVF